MLIENVLYCECIVYCCDGFIIYLLWLEVLFVCCVFVVVSEWLDILGGVCICVLILVVLFEMMQMLVLCDGDFDYCSVEVFLCEVFKQVVDSEVVVVVIFNEYIMNWVFKLVQQWLWCVMVVVWGLLLGDCVFEDFFVVLDMLCFVMDVYVD